MKLTVIGGGGFRIPQLAMALADDPLITELVLTDIDERRLRVIREVIGQLRLGDRLQIRSTTDLASAVAGAHFVFVAIRVGGTRGRVLDEEIPLRHGVIGQETVGPGGTAYALRTVPVARTIAATIKEHAPDAWTLNFTNPVGVITEAMVESLGERVLGICDTPIGLLSRLSHLLGSDFTSFDYVGLNHFGWLRSVTTSSNYDGVARVLSDPHLASQIEEVQEFGAEVLGSLGMIPTEYVSYYSFEAETLARMRGRERRGSYLERQQARFYRAAEQDPARALELWRTTLTDREETYGGEGRADPATRRSGADIAFGGYQKVAVEMMRTLAGQAPPRLTIANVPNSSAGGTVIGALPESCVVEAVCEVGAGRVSARRSAPLPLEVLAPMLAIKGADDLILRATRDRDPNLALRAFAANPLVHSLRVARSIMGEYCEEIPAVAAAIGWREEAH